MACRCLDAAGNERQWPEPITLDDHSVIVAEGAKEFIWEPEVLIFPNGKLLGTSSEICGSFSVGFLKSWGIPQLQQVSASIGFNRLVIVE